MLVQTSKAASKQRKRNDYKDRVGWIAIAMIAIGAVLCLAALFNF